MKEVVIPIEGQLKRRDSWAESLVFGIIALAIALILLHDVVLAPEPGYEDLLVTDAVVDYFDYHRSFRGSYIATLVTTDGKNYRITGKYDDDELKDKLIAGVDVKIKYYERTAWVFFNTNCAKELTVNNEVIASYHNYYVINAIIYGFAVVCLMSISGFLLWDFIKQIVFKR
jgi:hypothetical protein